VIVSKPERAILSMTSKRASRNYHSSILFSRFKPLVRGFHLKSSEE
jgi:hypothetical protein